MMKFFTLLLTLLPFLGFSQATDLFISEYGEGAGGNKKYIEIYNGTGSTVDLSEYQLWKNSNGSPWNATTLALSGNLLDGATYVIANNNTDVIGADLYNTFISFNGDDATGLAKFNGSTYVLIDVFGEENVDPGSGWDVAGVTNATVDKILIRKATVCSPNVNWTTSRGTNATDSEWTILVDPYNATNQTTNLGSHTSSCTAGCNLTASGISALTCNDNGTGAITADDYISFSLNPTGSNLGTNYTVTVSSGTVSPTTAAYGSATSFQLQAGSAGAGNVTITITDDSGTSCTIDQVITDPGVCSSAVPVITLTPSSLTGFNQVVGTPSAEQTFTASGLSLTTDLVLTAPSNFEISLTSGTGFTSSISLPHSSGTVSATTIYTRSNAAAMGSLNAFIIGTSTAAENDTVVVSGYADDYVTYMVDEINGTNANGVADSLNVLVSVTGVVQCGDFDYNAGYSFALIDGNGDGINIYRSSDLANYTSPMDGDSIVVRGKVLQFNGLTEIQADSIQLLGTGATATPLVVTTLSEANESMPVEVMNLTLVTPIATFAANSSILANNGTDTVSIRIPSNSPLDGTAAPQGLFNVTGIGWQYDSSSPYTSGYQLYPCDFEDVCTTPSNATTLIDVSTASADAAGLSYQWINCSDNSVVNGATNQVFTAEITANYAVIITDGACSDTSDCINLLGTNGINENTLLNSVSVYPNPVQDFLTVKNTSNELVSFIVVDINGKEVLSPKSVLTSEIISTSTWNKGVYFVKFTSESGEAVLRIVK